MGPGSRSAESGLAPAGDVTVGELLLCRRSLRPVSNQHRPPPAPWGGITGSLMELRAAFNGTGISRRDATPHALPLQLIRSGRGRRVSRVGVVCGLPTLKTEDIRLGAASLAASQAITALPFLFLSCSPALRSSFGLGKSPWAGPLWSSLKYNGYQSPLPPWRPGCASVPGHPTCPLTRWEILLRARSAAARDGGACWLGARAGCTEPHAGSPPAAAGRSPDHGRGAEPRSRSPRVSVGWGRRALGQGI